MIEYDDVEPAPAGSTKERYDFEIVVRRSVRHTSYTPEIVFAYGPMQNPRAVETIGLENIDGSQALHYPLPDDIPLHEGLILCFDWMEAISITYQARIDPHSPYTTLVSQVENSVGYPHSGHGQSSHGLPMKSVLHLPAMQK